MENCTGPYTWPEILELYDATDKVTRRCACGGHYEGRPVIGVIQADGDYYVHDGEPGRCGVCVRALLRRRRPRQALN